MRDVSVILKLQLLYQHFDIPNHSLHSIYGSNCYREDLSPHKKSP